MTCARCAEFHCHPTFWRINECRESLLFDVCGPTSDDANVCTASASCGRIMLGSDVVVNRSVIGEDRPISHHSCAYNKNLFPPNFRLTFINSLRTSPPDLCFRKAHFGVELYLHSGAFRFGSAKWLVYTDFIASNSFLCKCLNTFACY